MSDSVLPPVVLASVTAPLPTDVAGRVLVGGSHGGIYATYLALKAGARAAIHNDAGIGHDDAGIAGLGYAERHGMAMAVVASTSARIGDGEDMMQRGVISHANALALESGVTAGMRCSEAVPLLAGSPWPHADAEPLNETHSIVTELSGRWRIVCADAISLVGAADRGAIVACGSHGGLSSAQSALQSGLALVVFNDAGFGIERAGIAGLAMLDQAAIPAATVGTMTARIGDGRSTLYDGVISAANRAAERMDTRVGERMLDLVRRLNDSPRG